MAVVDVRTTFGALLLGALVACLLSGVVALQCSMYFRTYSSDSWKVKSLVGIVWVLDLCHTCFICLSIWEYVIVHYGESTFIDDIPWCIPMTIVLTAFLTFLVHCFFAHRLYKLSRGKWWIAGPIAGLALSRLGCACVTSIEMLRLQTFTKFASQFRWVFTLGLAISSVVDVLIAGCLCYFLTVNRTKSCSLNRTLDALRLYIVEHGSITCASTVISMICWLVMPHNRVFLGLHFVISKLYANSLLASLNARENLRHSRERSADLDVPVIFDGHGNSFATERHRGCDWEIVSSGAMSIVSTPGSSSPLAKNFRGPSQEGLQNMSTLEAQNLQISVMKPIEEFTVEDNNPLKGSAFDRGTAQDSASVLASNPSYYV